MNTNNNQVLAAWIRDLIAKDKLYQFYKSKEWMTLRDDVLREHHHECQHCLRHGIYTRAYMVHHVNEVRKRPDMALTKIYIDEEEQERKNLVPLCFACHEAEHDRFERVRLEQDRERFTNEERW